MKYNNVSVLQVISKVMMDLNISEEQQRVSDYIEWTAEAIELIGAPVQMETVSSLDGEYIAVAGYQAILPSNIINILSVNYSETEDGLYRKIFPSTAVGDILSDQLYMYRDIKYSIKPGYINVNIPEGFIKLTYTRMYTDENGVPLVPDLMSYLEAIYWYIVMKLTYPLWRIGKIRDVVYYDAKKSWSFFKNKAYGEMMMPTYDQYSHNIKNIWNKLIPEMNEEYSDLRNIGEQEKVRLT